MLAFKVNNKFGSEVAISQQPLFKINCCIKIQSFQYCCKNKSSSLPSHLWINDVFHQCSWSLTTRILFQITNSLHPLGRTWRRGGISSRQEPRFSMSILRTSLLSVFSLLITLRELTNCPQLDKHIPRFSLLFIVTMMLYLEINIKGEDNMLCLPNNVHKLPRERYERCERNHWGPNIRDMN